MIIKFTIQLEINGFKPFSRVSWARLKKTVRNRDGEQETAQADRAALVLELAATGASVTKIAQEVYGYGNNFYIGKVRQILEQQQQQHNIAG